MWQLMSNDVITIEDRESLSDFILHTNKFTQGECVDRFEKEWSEWQGCKYSVFVNSGSSANLIAIDVAKQLYGNNCVCQATTWSTNVSPVIQLGMNLQLCDSCLDNFGIDESSLQYVVDQYDPSILFVTHILGFPALTPKVLQICKDNNIAIIEDCCESHGAMIGDIKVGNFGDMSTFSFYYGHHMTTVEGGMVCTDDENIYHKLLLARSHGLLRSLPEHARVPVDGVDPSFTFLSTGYNVRNTEIGALLGSMQLKRLNSIIDIRNRNLHHFMENIRSTEIKSDYNLEGVSSFALPIFCENIERVKEILDRLSVEWRPLIAGNLFRHPIMDNVKQVRMDLNAEYLHNNAVYIGNHQDVSTEMIERLTVELR